MDVRPFTPADTDEVVALWHECDLVRPWNDPRLDIQRKQSFDAGLFLVGTVGDRVVGTVMAGYEGRRGWINYLAVRPADRRRGYGRQLMAAAEADLAERGCPKINLQVRSANAAAVAFYEGFGYRVDDVVSLGKRLACDTAVASPAGDPPEPRSC